MEGRSCQKPKKWSYQKQKMNKTGLGKFGDQKKIKAIEVTVSKKKLKEK